MKRNASILATGLSVALAVAALSGCAGTARSAKPAPVKPQPKMAAPVNQTKYEPPILEGKVIETMSVGSYTYILLEKDGKTAWSAIPVAEVKVGEELSLVPGIDMLNFKSTILGRTFGNIHFSAGVKGGKPYVMPAAQKQPHADAATPGLPPAPPPLSKLETEASPKYQPVLSGKVVESVDSNGYTYVCLENEGLQTWAAIPATKVKAGTDITVYPGNIMHAFTSKSLNRTFENIVFSRGVVQIDEE